MDFEIQRLFKAETLVTEDPWGLGYKFFHKSTADPDYRDWLAAQAGNRIGDEIQRRMRTRVAREMLQKARNGKGSAKSAAMDEEFLEEVRDDILHELAETYEADDASKVDEARGVALLLTGWEGVTDINGEEVPYDAEAAYELLSSRTVIPQDQEGAGALVGSHLCQLILESARGALIVDSIAMDAAEKKSDAATDGN